MVLHNKLPGITSPGGSASAPGGYRYTIPGVELKDSSGEPRILGIRFQY